MSLLLYQKSTMFLDAPGRRPSLFVRDTTQFVATKSLVTLYFAARKVARECFHRKVTDIINSIYSNCFMIPTATRREQIMPSFEKVSLIAKPVWCAQGFALTMV